MNYLEITTGDTRYAYATGRIRGLEKYLLKEAEFSRIKEGKDLAESFQELSRFYPYSDSMKICQQPSGFERGLEEEWRRTYRELRSFVPEPELIDLFWIDQDFHNFKVLFKLKAQKKLPEDIERIENLSSAGTLDSRLVAEAVLREDFSNLPLFLKDIFQQVAGIIEKGAAPREIDFFLDRAYFRIFLSGMQSYKDGFLTELTKKIIDGYNIKNFLRI
ncbi:V-type ATPase subunit, partial [Candidatus Aerophobetes bacterium]|nr:V-type ATPase subunit [Candidatus Aerophobetes bacterium]